MKTKINLKKGILLFTIVSMLIGCGITVIPTLVTKDITLAKVTVFGLQDKETYTTATTVDLTKMVDADKLKALTTAKIKSFSLKIGDDYLNTVSNSTQLLVVFGVAIVQGLPDELDFSKISETYRPFFRPKTGDAADIQIEGGFGDEGAVSIGNFDSANREFFKYTFTQPLEMKDYIVDGKLKLNIAIANYPNGNLGKFNDNSFTFELQVETEVEVEL